MEVLSEGSQFGNAIASGGDVNGDGFDGVIIGTIVSQAVGAPNIGSAYVYLAAKAVYQR